MAEKMEGSVRCSWTGFFGELLSILCRDYDSTTLAVLAHEIFHDTPSLKDQFKDGRSGPLKELDPLTFIGYFNRSLKDERRIGYCRAIKEKLKLKTAVPVDFTGIPIINNQASWFFPYAKYRDNDTFPRLWKFARALNQSSLNDQVFGDALNIKGVGLAKLTQLCFICKPARYLPLDKNTIEYLSAEGLESVVSQVCSSGAYSDYESLLSATKEKFPAKTMADISSHAYHDFGGTRYWVVGATWDKVDKSQEFIENSQWINGFTSESGDKSLDRVRQVSIGDWIAIKSAFVKKKRISCIRIKAVGRVTENSGDGRNLKVSWIFKGEPFDVDGASYMQTIHEVTDTVDQSLIFHNSFRPARKALKSPTITDTSNQKKGLPKNLIFFGPPGVGKTYRILELREKFTSVDEADEATRIANWVSEQSWWTVIAATMIDLKRIVSVSEIEAHPFLQAKIRQSTNKTPKNTIWSWLQKHTVKHSKTVNFQQRIEPLVFDKTEDSKWFLAGEWEESLSDLKIEVDKIRSNRGEAIKRYEVVTFHQAYSYEDFVEGIRPVTNDESESLRYSIESGVFKRMCERAKGDPDNDYAIFIDEINRGNIAKVFGELITLIEEDKREQGSNPTKAILPYSKLEFSVPSNLYLIGTMNSVDRSIALLDMALRRRFQFQRIDPNPELVIDEIEGVNFRSIYRELNDRISVLLGEDYQLGHSYFMEERIVSADVLKVVWFENILPLFRECFFDDWDKLKALVPPFIEEQQIRGLENLGLINNAKYCFSSGAMSTESFVERLKELASFLQV